MDLENLGAAGRVGARLTSGAGRHAGGGAPGNAR